jgi:hypothetical protein
LKAALLPGENGLPEEYGLLPGANALLLLPVGYMLPDA